MKNLTLLLLFISLFQISSGQTVLEALPGVDVLTLQTIDPNWTIKQGRVTTTDATITTLQTIPIIADRTYHLNTVIIARRTGGTAGTADDGASYGRWGTYTTKTGTVTELASIQTALAEDVFEWITDFIISGTDVLIIVKGSANMNITWHCTTEISYVGT